MSHYFENYKKEEEKEYEDSKKYFEKTIKNTDKFEGFLFKNTDKYEGFLFEGKEYNDFIKDNELNKKDLKDLFNKLFIKISDNDISIINNHNINITNLHLLNDDEIKELFVSIGNRIIIRNYRNDKNKN